LVSGPVSSMVCSPTLPKTRIDGRIVDIGGVALECAARAEFCPEGGIARIVEILGLLLGIEVIEVAEELVKAASG
jgi:hypothetical protein